MGSISLRAWAGIAILVGADVVTKMIGSFSGWVPGGYSPIQYWVSPLLPITIGFVFPGWAFYFLALYSIERWIRLKWLGILARVALLAIGILVYLRFAAPVDAAWNFQLTKWMMLIFLTAFTFVVKPRRFKPLD